MPNSHSFFKNSQKPPNSPTRKPTLHSLTAKHVLEMSVKLNLLCVRFEKKQTFALVVLNWFSTCFYYFISNGGRRGGGKGASGFSSITQKREIFSSNLVTFCTDKWVTICTIKLEDRPFHVAMATAQIKEAQK